MSSRMSPANPPPRKDGVHLGRHPESIYRTYNYYFLCIFIHSFIHYKHLYMAQLSWHLSTTVWDLSVTLDQNLILSEHVRNVCCMCFYHLHHIQSACSSLTTKN